MNENDPVDGSEATPSAGTSLTLLTRLKGNEPEAWERLVRLYGPLVMYWARRAGLGDADAADLLQEVMRSVSGSIARFERERTGATFRGWLWTIARNKLRDHARLAAQRPNAIGGSDAQDLLKQIPDEEPDSSPDSEPSRTLLQSTLETVKTSFEPRTWDAFWRTTVDGRSPNEVAHELGIGLASVYQARSRVLRRLREELGELLD